MVTATLLLGTALATPSSGNSHQAHDLKPAEALAQVAFLVGEWKGKQDFNTGGPAMVLEAKDSIQLAIGGRYVEEKLATTRPNGSLSDTRHLLTFVPKDGKFHAWWFNDSSAGAMELTGEMADGKLVLTSTPVETGKGPANIFRATYERLGDRGLAWTLELKQGDTWQKLFKTSYTK